ncbi:homoserine kinase [Campylobacter hyointestinalis]|uniref:Homoserine kinase n=1 Tax=Campylobacter hyointestinalis subsp. lawsonii TaxID=91353 RepID=A0AAV6ED19_CAMHY|nr:homoserine kinase [Campylobacter hyointestinalis]KAB0611394.1 homoserine kinase [Campylobacter hyointestinalis subsp. lawsonii]QKF68798.1 homoserine kinase [Campylobacter hyointestinalis subsp. lawsonii]RAZ27968.1 homoserine kinase [Campylobacter hyointestinalis subsp. lawsonii]
MKILTPATSANLGPGFDSLGLALKLYNEVVVSPQKFTSISIVGEGSDKISLRKNNTFINIFNQIVFELTGKHLNFKFSFTNNIPFSRGLGSSSSVIVSAIALAYQISGFKTDRQQVLNRALEFENHPDNISPAVWGGFTANVVHKGVVYSHKMDLSSDLRAVVVIPNNAMSTKQSRGKLPKSYSMKDVVSNISHAAYLTACFMSKDYTNLKIASIDKMHEEIRMQGLNELFEIRELAYNNGALMSNLSGSGSSFLNLTYKDDANRLKDLLKQRFGDFRVEVFELDNNGFMISQK